MQNAHNESLNFRSVPTVSIVILFVNPYPYDGLEIPSHLRYGADIRFERVTITP